MLSKVDVWVNKYVPQRDANLLETRFERTLMKTYLGKQMTRLFHHKHAISTKVNVNLVKIPVPTKDKSRLDIQKIVFVETQMLYSCMMHAPWSPHPWSGRQWFCSNICWFAMVSCWKMCFTVFHMQMKHADAPALCPEVNKAAGSMNLTNGSSETVKVSCQQTFWLHTWWVFSDLKWICCRSKFLIFATCTCSDLQASVQNA